MTGHQLDITPFTITFWAWPFSQFFTQRRVKEHPSKPWTVSFSSRVLWERVSKLYWSPGRIHPQFFPHLFSRLILLKGPKTGRTQAAFRQCSQFTWRDFPSAGIGVGPRMPKKLQKRNCYLVFVSLLSRNLALYTNPYWRNTFVKAEGRCLASRVKS